MKNNYLLILFAICLVVSLSGEVLGLTCNGSEAEGYHLGDGSWLINSTSITNGCTLSSAGTYVMSGESFNLNSSTTSPAIQISSNNIILDCNNSIVFGNFTDTYNLGATNFRPWGIYSTTRTNVTIKNCNLDNYYHPIYFRHGFDFYADNISISNSYSGIFIWNSTNGTIKNVYSYNSQLFGIGNSINLNFYNSTNFNATNLNISLLASGVKVYMESTDIKNKNIYFSNVSVLTGGYYSIEIDDADNVSIVGGIFKDSLRYSNIAVRYNSSNVNINNVISIGADKGIMLNGVQNVTVLNSNISNSYGGYDGFYVGAYVNVETPDETDFKRNKNINFTNNNFINYGCVGLLFRDTDEVYIYNNIFNSSGLNSQPTLCDKEPFSAIMFEEIYKGFVPVGTPSWLIYGNTSWHNSTDVSILGNQFYDVGIKLRLQGTLDIVHDLSDYVYKAFQNSYLMDKDEFYIDSSFNNVSTFNNGVYLTELQQGRYGNYLFNYSIFSDYMIIKNINLTMIQNFTIFNLTSSLLTNGTSLCNGSTGLMTGNVNITLNPNESCYVLDDFNSDTDYNRLSSLIGTTNANNIYHQLGFFTQADKNQGKTVCNSMFLAFGGFSGFIPIFFSILAVVVIVSIVGIIIYAIKTKDAGTTNITMVIGFTMLMGIVVVIAVVGMIILNAMCGGI